MPPPPEPCPLDGAVLDRWALEERWRALLEQLRERVSENAVEVWLARLHSHGERDGALELGAPSHIALRVEQRFGRLLERAAGMPVRLVACEQAELMTAVGSGS